MKATSRPLDDVTVVSLEQAISAPLCTRHLADLGARVIKVERPGGGDFARAYDTRARGMSSHFVWTNRSKESLTLDLKQPEALAALMKLLVGADVLVQNLAPGAADRLGLSYAELGKAFPRLIVCGISGYGPDGPYRDKKAYDLLIQSESGFVSTTGTPEEPAKAGASVADIAAGMYAHSSILSALIQRGRTGKGCNIDISMFECMVEWMSFPLYYTLDGAQPPVRAGASHATIFPYGPFQAGDGKTVIFGIQNEREWRAFCEVVLEDAQLSKDERFSSTPKRAAARDALRPIIDSAFARLDAAEVMVRLERAQIANAQMNSMADVWSHPQLQERGRWTEVNSPVGALPALLPPWSASTFAAHMGAVPALGEQTDAILAEVGYSTQDLAALRAKAAI